MPSFEEIRARLEDLPWHSPADRDRFLRETCGSDESLLTLANALIDKKLASQPVIGPVPDRRVGPYKLERELGRGGMGVVYLASRDDEQFRRKVAIKLLQPGNEGDEVLRRFQNERQILANLDHPNICRMFDGGLTHAGESYFVMEYIRGARPLDEYCAAQALSLTARLELFRQACAAVQYAHRFLIVHRDLKPGNILVSEEGEVKLMDFGIAKNLLGSFETGFFNKTIGTGPMTPAYASPEQVRGEPISTGSDVYSLGVVLYEILTGRHPFIRKEQPLPDLLNSICETEPARPSSVVTYTREEVPPIRGKQLEGDLDWIVLMALRKDPLRRYGSVEQLSEDIRRHLEGRTVTARKDTVGYRATKFIGRNKVGSAAAALIGLTLAGGIISTRIEQTRTQARFNDVRQLANSLLFEINDSIRDLPGSTPARMLLVKSSLTYLDKLSKEAGHDASLQLELAEAYQKIGEIQYIVGGANIGDIDGALASARKEEAIRESLASKDGTVKNRLALATAHRRMSALLEGTGDPQGSARHLDQAIAIREALFAGDPKNAEIRAELAATYRAAGDKLKTRSETAAAVEMNRKAMAIREGLLAERPDDPEIRRQFSMDLVRIGDLLGSQNEANLGRYEDARDLYMRALGIRESLRAANPASATAARDSCNVLQRLGSLLINMKAYDEALAYSRTALEILGRLWRADRANFELRRDIGVVHNQIGRVLEKTHNLAGAEQSLREAVAVNLELLRKNPKSDRSQDDLSGSRMLLGGLLVRQGRGAEAMAPLQQARESVRHLMDRNPDVSRYPTKLMKATGAIAAAHAQQQDLKRACLEYRTAVDLANDLARQNKLGANDKDEPARLAKAMEVCSR